MNLNKNLIFMHIPKNAGTTLDTILNRSYPLENRFDIYPIANNKLNTEEFINLSDSERKKIHVLKGHIDFGIHNYLFGETGYITLLRRPEERIISYYYYILSLPSHRLYQKVKNENMSLYDFVTQLKDGDINNAQIRIISGLNDTDEVMLAKALENIKNHFSFVGLVEKYDESLILLQNIYALKTPYYKSLNTTPFRVMVNDLDQKTLNAIVEFNKGDIQLYNIIEKKFNTELNNLKLKNIKLKKLKLYNFLYKLYSYSKVAMLKSNN